MRELTTMEAQAVSGAWAKNWLDFGLGAVVGSWSGAVAGMALGGKFGTGGGWIVGGIAQLVGWAGSAAFGFVAGGVLGAVIGGDEAKVIVVDWVDKIGPNYALSPNQLSIF